MVVICGVIVLNVIIVVFLRVLMVIVFLMVVIWDFWNCLVGI